MFCYVLAAKQHTAARGSFALVRSFSSANQRSERTADVSGRHRWLRGGAWNCMTAMADVTPDRPFHLVVFGATGFTGGFVVEEVARRAADSLGGGPLKWAVAGRCRRRLEDVLSRAAHRLCRCSGRPPLWYPGSSRLYEWVTVLLWRPHSRKTQCRCLCGYLIKTSSDVDCEYGTGCDSNYFFYVNLDQFHSS